MANMTDSGAWSESEVQSLIYGISHDMGAPLRAVTQFSQMLQQRLEGKLDEKEAYWLQLVQENGEHAQRLTEALLVYSRLSTKACEPKQFSLAVVVDQALSDLKSKIETTNAVITLPPNFPNMVGYEAHWKSYFNHVLSNALLYQPMSQTHCPEVRISASVSEHGRLHIVVEDNGIGVSSMQRSMLSVPFKRLQNPNDYPGLGMGLAYCARIAQLSGGELTFVDSSMGGLAVTYVGPEDRQSWRTNDAEGVG